MYRVPDTSVALASASVIVQFSATSAVPDEASTELPAKPRLPTASRGPAAPGVAVTAEAVAASGPAISPARLTALARPHAASILTRLNIPHSLIGPLSSI